MQLRELFDLKLFLVDEVLDDDQVDKAFLSACITFFSIVKIKIVKYSDEYNLLTEFKEISSFTDIELVEYSIISPTNFDNFDLPLQYNEDFLSVCEFVIIQTSIKNIAMLKNLNIEEMQQTQQQDITQIKEYLTRKYSTSIGKTLLP
jgi:hypothetical protein